MWIMSVYGFYSVVQNENAPAEMLVRARVRKHLETLSFINPIGSFNIIETTDSDYRFRAFVPRDQWVKISAWLANDIDYGNFKTAARETEDSFNGKPYTRFLNETWIQAVKMQQSVLKSCKEST
jgi:hypothetical protein